jgi:hypothetical protein
VPDKHREYSPGTEAFDRGKKFRHYRRIDTLKEYVLIDTDKMNVECYRLNERGKWELTSYSPEEMAADGTNLEVHLPSVDFRCPISLLYENVFFPEDNSRRNYGCVLHLDIKDGKIWIQHDGTEEGIAKALVELGVSKPDIVLAFHDPSMRKYTGFAIY